MRLREGEKLRDDVVSRLDEISRLTGIVEQESPRTVAEYRARLEQKLQEVLGSTNIDESRILTEAAIFADKVAVDEVFRKQGCMDVNTSVFRKLQNAFGNDLSKSSYHNNIGIQFLQNL